MVRRGMAVFNQFRTVVLDRVITEAQPFDHPATHATKIRLFKEASIAFPRNGEFAPVDLECENLPPPRKVRLCTAVASA